MIKYKGIDYSHIAQSLALLSGQGTIQRIIPQKPNKKSEDIFFVFFWQLSSLNHWKTKHKTYQSYKWVSWLKLNNEAGIGPCSLLKLKSLENRHESHYFKRKRPWSSLEFSGHVYVVLTLVWDLRIVQYKKVLSQWDCCSSILCEICKIQTSTL